MLQMTVMKIQFYFHLKQRRWSLQKRNHI